MDPCKLDKRFEQLNSLGSADVYTLYLGYDKQVQEHPECANTDHYLQLYKALDRTQQGKVAGGALGLAYFASIQMQVRNPGNRIILNRLWEQSIHDKNEVLAQISSNQTEVPPPADARDWHEVGCANDEKCIEKFDASLSQFYQQIRRYLSQSLHAKYNSGGNVNVTIWLLDTFSIGAWQRDPKIVLDVMDHFIETRKLKLSDEDVGERANMLIVLRDLLRITSDTKNGQLFKLPDAALAQYSGADRWSLPGIGLGVGAYLQFVNEFQNGALPDAALMKKLVKMSDNKNFAREVEQKVLARQKSARMKK